MAAEAGTAVERGFETKMVAGQFECHGRVVEKGRVLSACGTITDETPRIQFAARGQEQTPTRSSTFNGKY
jgi:hypothetical protein